MTHSTTTVRFTDVSTPADVADALGTARAELKDAQDRVKFLESLLKAGDADLVEGRLFRVKIARDVEQSRVDWKAVAAKLNPSRQLVTAHTSVSVFDRLTVSALAK